MKRICIVIPILLNFFYSNVNAQDEYIDKIEKLSKECNEGNMSACKKIKEMAKNDKSYYLRRLALEKLTDQTLLKDIALTDKEPYLRVMATRKLTDQDLLKLIATTEKDPYLRIAATENMADTVLAQNIVYNFAFNVLDYDSYSTEDLRVAAAKLITNQSALKKIVIDSRYEKMRIVAINKLNDQSIIKDVAINDKSEKMRIAAYKRLADTTLIITDLDFFKYNQSLKVKLMQWEQEAPDSVKKEIDHLRGGYTSTMVADASRRLQGMKENAKGAILPLMQFLGNEAKIITIGGYSGYSETTLSSIIRSALIEIGNPAFEPLCYALNNDDIIIRRRASDALFSIGYHYPFANLDSSLAKRIINAFIDNRDPKVRSSLAGVMSFLKDPAVAEILMDALDDKNAEVHREVILSLGRLGNKRALDPLISILNDTMDVSRGYAAEALGNLKATGAIEPLINVLNDKDLYVKAKANDALEKITGVEFYGNSTKWKPWWEEQKAKKK